MKLKRKLSLLILFTLLCIHLSCDTELFELDKLSQNTGLTPSVQLPVAGRSPAYLILDSSDFDVDYDRDSYATIYVSDSIQRLVETSFEDVYDPTGLYSEVESSYSLSPIELENTNNDFNRISMSEATNIPNGSTTVIPAFQITIVLGTIDMYNEPYRSARFFDGSILFTCKSMNSIDVTKYITTIKITN